MLRATKAGDLRTVSWDCPAGCVHRWMLCSNKRGRRPAVPWRPCHTASHQARHRSRPCFGTRASGPRYDASSVRDVVVAVSPPLRARENHCERHSHQAFVQQAFAHQALGFQIPARKAFARRTPASQRPRRHARPRREGRIAAGHPAHRTGCLRTHRHSDHLRDHRALSRKSILPADHDGLHRRYHAVAGRQFPRALSCPARARRRPDRQRSRRRRRLHDRPARLARHGMEQQTAGAGLAPEGEAARFSTGRLRAGRSCRA